MSALLLHNGHDSGASSSRLFNVSYNLLIDSPLSDLVFTVAQYMNGIGLTTGQFQSKNLKKCGWSLADGKWSTCYDIRVSMCLSEFK